jgi:hypothetical protein
MAQPHRRRRKMKAGKIISIVGFLFLGSSLSAKVLHTTIEDIFTIPTAYRETTVEVEGYVSEYEPGTSPTVNYYLLKGDYGQPIRVTTSMEHPAILSRLRVTGICYLEGTMPFISEAKRVALPKIIRILGLDLERKTLFIVLFVFLGLLLAFLIYYQFRIRKPISEEEPFPLISVPSGFERKQRDDFRTVKIYNVPETMKLIPGKLVILSGLDSGKEFQIAGRPSAQGNVATIGRETVSGDQVYSHIQLDDPLQTVSRKQALLIERRGRVYLQNITKVNKTQVDGKELEMDEEIELKSSARIKMGYLELKYVR